MTTQYSSTRKLAAGAAALLLAHGAQASMGNLATTYGLLPTDMASAQSYSLFNTQVSAAYYNPAALALSPKGNLTVGMLQATPSLTVESNGGPNAPVRNGSVLEADQTKTALFGMKTNITSLTKFKKPVYLAVIGGVEQYGAEMLAFESESSNEGQFMQYGQKPLFLAASGAMNLMDGVDLGFGLRVTLHANATLTLETDLAGNTSSENPNVSAEPVFIPVFGAHFDMDKLLCNEQSGCQWSGLDLAVAYRGSSNTQTTVDATATIPGTVTDPGLPLVVNTLDAYQPMILSFGANYQLLDNLNVAATLEYQNWSKLTDELEKDTVKDQANLKFDDVIIPRVGSRFDFNDTLTISAGVSYETSALASSISDEVNLFDNDRLVVAAGFTQMYTQTKFLAFPLQIDGAYQYHHLVERDFSLSSNGTVFENVTTGGDAHVFSMSLSMMF
jgi:long-subunit fatty acid transport protein